MNDPNIHPWQNTALMIVLGFAIWVALWVGFGVL